MRGSSMREIIEEYGEAAVMAFVGGIILKIFFYCIERM